VEYCFWNESKPEALVQIGTPLMPQRLGGKDWTMRIECELVKTLDALATDAMSRDSGRFTTLTAGRVGVGGVYDLWRRGKAILRGERFDPAHEAAK
jgi:hypothetical protein